LLQFQPVTNDTVYATGINRIYTVSTGAVSWASADVATGPGALGGPDVVFLSGNNVLAQPY